jgi:hypothetical protein
MRPRAADALSVMLLLALAAVAGAEQQQQQQDIIIREGVQSERYASAMKQFFGQLDQNRDGELDSSEVGEFIDSNLRGQTYETVDVDTAAEAMIANVDSVDSGVTISQAELDAHVLGVLQGVKVWDWVNHGLGMPQYADAFRQQGITVGGAWCSAGSLQRGGGAARCCACACRVRTRPLRGR